MLNYFYSIVGKSFEYWKNVYDENTIDIHAINLRLAHLKYALDQNLITNEEYYIHRSRITDWYSPSSTEYKPCTLTDFSNALKMHYLSGKLEMNQSLKNYQYSEKVQKSILNPSENISKQNKTTVDLKEHFQDKKQNISTKSKKKRTKKKKFNINSFNNANYDYTNINNNEEMEDVQDECYKQIEYSTKQIVKRSNGSVKIFVRQTNKKYKSETVSKESLVSTKRTVRDIFSKILKDFKKERALIL